MSILIVSEDNGKMPVSHLMKEALSGYADIIFACGSSKVLKHVDTNYMRYSCIIAVVDVNPTNCNTWAVAKALIEFRDNNHPKLCILPLLSIEVHVLHFLNILHGLNIDYTFALSGYEGHLYDVWNNNSGITLEKAIKSLLENCCSVSYTCMKNISKVGVDIIGGSDGRFYENNCPCTNCDCTSRLTLSTKEKCDTFLRDFPLLKCLSNIDWTSYFNERVNYYEQVFSDVGVRLDIKSVLGVPWTFNV